MEEVKKAPRPIFNMRFFLMLLVAWFLFHTMTGVIDSQEIPFDQFQAYLKEGKIKDVTISGENVTGNFKKAQKGQAQFRTTLVDKDLAREFEKYDVSFRKVPESAFTGILLTVFLPILLFWGFWFFLIRRTMGKSDGLTSGFPSIGKSKAKIYVEKDTKVTFKDVAGEDEALEELKEVIEFLKNSEKFTKLGGKMPKGVLLIGPPGTGKTLIAKAVAGEAGVPFFSTNGAEFVEMFVGVGASRVRDLFEQAKASAPCIIFIDELDALGRARHASPIQGNDEKEQTLNQLLVEMDGFDTKAGVIILAATNRPEIIDPALLRAGRFDRQVLIDRPDKKGREDILKIHVRKVVLAQDVNLEHVAGITPGFSGADLANLVNEAALIATRSNAEAVTTEHFVQAFERMLTGLQKKNRLLNAFERKVVAHHEMGHALTGHHFNQEEMVHKVSIIPRGIGALGYTLQRPMEDRYLMTRTELENKMTVLLAGRAAETLIFSHLSTGATDDLVKASNIARDMVTKYGMTTELGFVSYESPRSHFLLEEGLAPEHFSDHTAEAIDENVKHLIMNAFHRAFNFLKENRAVLEASAQELMQKETLTEKELTPYFQRIRSAEFENSDSLS